MANKSLKEVIFDDLSKKYFQDKDKKDDLVYMINEFGVSNKPREEYTLLGYSPILEKQIKLPLFLLDSYTEISRKDFESIVEKYKENKANLSA